MSSGLLVRVATAVVAASVGVVGALAWSVVEERPASATDFPVHEFNMCGRNCSNGGFWPVDVVAYLVLAANPRPVVVTLNEVCHP